MEVEQVLTVEVGPSPEEQANQILNSTLEQIANLFPITSQDEAMVEYGRSIYHVRSSEGKGRNQITVVRGASGKLYIGSHSEDEELEARADLDLPFTSSWSDALQNANSRSQKPDRIIDVVGLRWPVDAGKPLVVRPPDSVARQQYNQFCPGALFLVILNGRLVKMPIEAFYPWEYYSRPLPVTLAEQRPSWPFREEVCHLLKGLVLKVSNLFPLTAEDKSLIQMAEAEIQLKYAYGFWQLASAFITEQGNIRTGLQYHSDEEDDGCVGLQHDTKTGKANMDAEQAAIKKARRMYPGEQLKTIVTVHHSTDNHQHSGDLSLVSSCALCRKSLLKYSPNVKVIIPLNGKGNGKVPMRILYPLPDFHVG